MANMATSSLAGYGEQIKSWLEAGRTNTEIAELFKSRFNIETSEASVRRAIKANPGLQSAVTERNFRNAVTQEAEIPGLRVKNDSEVEVNSPVVGEWEDVSHLSEEKVRERHDLSVDEWDCTFAQPNTWQGMKKGGEIINYYQFKLTFKKRVPIELLMPWTPAPIPERPAKRDFDRPKLVVVVTDHQAPHQHEELHALFLQWLEVNDPDTGVIGGDLLDLGYIGRHRDDPAWDATGQQCIDAAGGILWDYVHASSTKWTLLKGNHDDRLRNEQLERNERLYGIKPYQYPGDSPQEPTYSLNHLLKLPALGINYVEPEGTYEFEQVVIGPEVVVRHGHKTAAGNKNSLNTANQIGHSVVTGHTHRQSLNGETKWDSINNRWWTIWGIEAGCMCKIEGGLGYATAGVPNWQLGFATVSVWADGTFTTDLAKYEQDGTLIWRDQRYSL